MQPYYFYSMTRRQYFHRDCEYFYEIFLTSRPQLAYLYKRYAHYNNRAMPYQLGEIESASYRICSRFTVNYMTSDSINIGTYYRLLTPNGSV